MEREWERDQERGAWRKREIPHIKRHISFSFANVSQMTEFFLCSSDSYLVLTFHIIFKSGKTRRIDDDYNFCSALL